MPQVRALLTKLSIEEGELPSLTNPPRTPCTPCSPSVAQTEAFLFHPAGAPKQVMIDGEIWPPIFKPEFVRSAKKLVPLSTDVFVCTYPKCGTTWIQHICSQLMNNDYGPEVGKVSELCTTSPMIERMGARYADNLKHPRLLKTHFTHGNCPKSSNAKYIYAVRNPKDCMASYFFHNRNFKIYDWAGGDFDTFFELFVDGHLAFGDYFDHLLSWLPHIHDENVLFLKYEDMVADLEGSIVKIGNFMGGRAAQIVNNTEHLARIVSESKIDAMKQNQGRWFPGSILHKETFIRKGGSRDWKNHMTQEQSDRLDKVFRRRMAGTAASNWWQSEMCWDEEEEEEDDGIHMVASPPELRITESPVTEEEEDSGAAGADRRHSFSSEYSSSVPLFNSSLMPTPDTNVADRRGSFGSVTSSGYNSMYSSSASLRE